MNSCFFVIKSARTHCESYKVFLIYYSSRENNDLVWIEFNIEKSAFLFIEGFTRHKDSIFSFTLCNISI